MATDGRSVLVTLDRERHLRYDFNALIELEGALGKRITELAPNADGTGGDISLKDVRTFLWAGLRHEDLQLTQADAGALVQAGIDGGLSLADISAKMQEALALSGYGDRAPKAAGSEVATGAAPLAASGDGSATPSV